MEFTITGTGMYLADVSDMLLNVFFFGCGKHSNFRPGVEVRAANLQNAGRFGCGNRSSFAFRFATGVQMPGHFVAVDRRWVLGDPG